MTSKQGRPHVTTQEGHRLRLYVDEVNSKADSTQAEVDTLVLGADYSIFTAADHSYAAWSLDPQFATTTSASTSGTLYVEKCKAAQAVAVTGLRLTHAVAGSGVTLAKVALYDSAGAQLAVSADDSANWGTAGDRTVPFTAASRTLAPGETLYMAFLFVATTGPTIRTATAAPALNSGLAASDGYRAGYLPGQSDMPATLTLGSLTGGTTRRLLFLVG